MQTIYYNNLFDLGYSNRKKKFRELLISSLKNDMSKWEAVINEDSTEYVSPEYNDLYFHIEFKRTSTIFGYIFYKNPIMKVKNNNGKLIPLEYEYITNDFTGELLNLSIKIRETIFTSEIKELEKLVGSTFSRKDKLDALEISHLTEIVEESYKDWENDQSESMARMIARVMYSYRNHEELYKLWEEKFSDINLITKELSNLGYTPKK
jgi:hypothetical protein